MTQSDKQQTAGQQPESLSDPDAGESRGKTPRLSSVGWRTLIKILLIGAFNAFALWGLVPMWNQRWWPGIAVLLIAVVAINWAYLSKRAIPAKYLIPGTILALIFSVIPVLYSGYIAFTNFSTANRLSAEQALEQIQSRVSNVPGAAQFDLDILAKDDGLGELGFFLTDEAGNEFLGTADGLEPLEPEDIIRDADGRLTGIDDFFKMNLGQISEREAEITREFQVQTDEGVIRAVTLSRAAIYEPLYRYDEASGNLTNIENGTVYTGVEGRFVSEDGLESLNPGWQTFVGFDNFLRILRNENIRGPFIRVFLWNYAFAILSVLLTFVVGLGLAVAMNHPAMRGKKVYRALMIVPYALPSFMTALIWAGMLNQEFGVINDVLRSDIPWLRDPTMAKVSVLLVNTWLGFPYMFLISTGALQAIPEELKEAAMVDGATSRQAFRRIILPLLMVSLAPLLIASFAFNFNNFNIIYLLNNGGPPIAGAQTPAGHTDILISYTFRLAFEGGRGQEWGFASAIALLIFFMVATISAISFRRTRALEELS
jgi:arabinogalactan oligomer/maltooligosaccharide transport system permease protein